ncbi:MAG: tryptophan-rich sensory protein [Oscillospiraceae bacterium]|nr:tryptophan-rich sensory protein [Oscillospiraceae bacterium]
MDRKIKWGPLALSIAAALAAGGIGAWLGGDFSGSYGQMYKPLLSPPGWVFPVVWTILYVLMGVAAWQVWQSEASRPRKKRALILYGAQLAMNAFWPLLFFRLGAYLAAFVWLVLLFAAVWLCALCFRYIRPSAGKLLTPYLLWLFFAGYLNLGVYLLN